jgi:hypothetical protein
MKKNEPVRNLEHLSPALRRVVEEPWRKKRAVNRPLKKIPNVEKRDGRAS